MTSVKTARLIHRNSRWICTRLLLCTIRQKLVAGLINNSLFEKKFYKYENNCSGRSKKIKTRILATKEFFVCPCPDSFICSFQFSPSGINIHHNFNLLFHSCSSRLLEPLIARTFNRSSKESTRKRPSITPFQMLYASRL